MPGVSEAASAAACAKRFDGPITKVSKVNLGFRCVGPASVGEETSAGDRLPFPLLLVRGRCGGPGERVREGGSSRVVTSSREGSTVIAMRTVRPRFTDRAVVSLDWCLLLDPLLGEAVGDGQEDRAFNIPEGPRGAQHRRRDGAQLVCGDRVEGRSPRACEGIRLHDNLGQKIR